MELNEGRVYFSLEGRDFHPDELTEFLGIKPTSVKIKSSLPSGQLPKLSSWQLSTENSVDECVDIYEMSAKIIKKLAPSKNLINQARRRFNVSTKLEVVLWISLDEECSMPVIGFDVETIRFLSDVGAFIDIDTYKK